MNTTSSKAVSLAEAKKIMEKREKDGELGYEQQQALEYLKKFAKDGEEAKVKEIAKNKKVPHETAVKIADIHPKKPETVKAILLKDRIDLSEEEIAEILKIVA